MRTDIYDAIDDRIAMKENPILEGVVLSTQGRMARVRIKGSVQSKWAEYSEDQGVEAGKNCLVLWIKNAGKYIVLSTSRGHTATDASILGRAELFPPQNLSANDSLPGSVILTWDVPPQLAVSFEIQKNTSAIDTGATTIASTRGALLIYDTLTNLYFRVRSVSSDWRYSGWSDWVLGIPGVSLSALFQPLDPDLTGLANATATGFIERTASGYAFHPQSNSYGTPVGTFSRNWFDIDTINSVNTLDALKTYTYQGFQRLFPVIYDLQTMGILGILTAPTVPILLTPIHNRTVNQLRLGTGTADRVSFTWTASTGADTYYWRFASSNTVDSKGMLTTGIIQSASGITTAYYAPTWLPNPPAVGTRYWQVGAENEGGIVWSSVNTVIVTADTAWTYGLARTPFSLGYRMNDAAAIYLKATNPARTEGFNILIDPTMEISGVTFWSVGNAATLTKSTASPHSGTNALRVAYNGTANPQAQQTILTGGKWYHFTGWMRGDGTATPLILINGGTSVAGTSSTSWQSFDFYAQGQSTAIFALRATTAIAGWCEFDDVTIKEVNIRASSEYPRLDIVTNGNFIGDYAWTKGAGTSIAAGVASFAAVAVGIGIAASTVTLVIGKQYDVTFTVKNYVSGSVRAVFGTALGTARNANGTYTQSITCAGSTTFAIQAVTAAFTGDIDDVIVVPTDGLLVFDPGFETWTSATNLTNWTEGISGTSTVNQETVVTHSGSNAVRLDIDSSNSLAQVAQSSLITGRRYKISYWAKSSVAGSTLGCDGVVFTSPALTTTWTQYEVIGVAVNTTLNFKRQAATSTSIYIDDLVLTEINPADLSVSGATMHNTAAAPFDYNVSFDGVNDAIFSPSTWMGGYIDYSQGSIVVVGQTDLPSDAANHYYVRVVFGAQELRIFKTTTANQVQTLVLENGVSAIQNLTVSDTNRHTIVNQWDIGASLKEAFLDGTEPVADVTTVGNIGGANLQLVIGSSNTTGANPFDGTIDMVLIFSDVLTPTEHLVLAQLAETG